jgi:hypothetical protein
MTLVNNFLQVYCLILGLFILTVPDARADHSKHQSKMKTTMQSKVDDGIDCKKVDVRCAKTMTSIFAPNGDLWRLWSHKLAMYYQISTDDGVNFSSIMRIDIPDEKISARNENRPKIAFDNKQGVYLSWAMPREKKYTADIRFSYSKDYGKNFSLPVTVNDDDLLTGHSFNEMQVDEKGNIAIVWLDGRLKTPNKRGQGSAIFMATGKASEIGSSKQSGSFFENKEVVNGTCVCCRLAIDENKNGNLAILWRHIYGDNIREFAVTTINEQKKPYQVSYDHWKINGCPHQGGSLSIDSNNRYHLVWFNQGDKGKGIFYSYSDDAGKTLSTPISVGEYAAQASHPHMSEYNGRVDIVWMQFTGKEHQLWHQYSTNKGANFTKAKIVAETESGADRPFILHNQGKQYVSWQRFKQGHWMSQL